MYDYPSEQISIGEDQRVMRKILSMKALHLHFNNFQVLKAIYATKKITKQVHFQQLLFTYDDPDHVSVLTLGCKPQKIQELSSGSKHS